MSRQQESTDVFANSLICMHTQDLKATNLSYKPSSNNHTNSHVYSLVSMKFCKVIEIMSLFSQLKT